MEICSVDGCDRDVYVKSRGWCSVHYNRWRVHGDVGATSRIVGDDVARFWSKVDKRGDNECWMWTGRVVSRTIYGAFRVAGTMVYAHRWSYEHHVGPIPRNHQIDHLCGVHLCVNPARLEAVTQAENLRRQLIASGGYDRRCTEPGCTRKHRCYGMCNMHYLRWKKAGRPAR